MPVKHLLAELTPPEELCWLPVFEGVGKPKQENLKKNGQPECCLRSFCQCCVKNK